MMTLPLMLGFFLLFLFSLGRGEEGNIADPVSVVGRDRQGGGFPAA